MHAIESPTITFSRASRIAKAGTLLETPMPETGVFDLAAFELNGWFYIPPGFLDDTSELVRRLGPLTTSFTNGTGYQDLIPYATHAAPEGSMSSIVGTGPQPIHTDR